MDGRLTLSRSLAPSPFCSAFLFWFCSWKTLTFPRTLVLVMERPGAIRHAVEVDDNYYSYSTLVLG